MCGRIFSPRRLCCMFLVVLTVGLVYMAVARPTETQSAGPSELPPRLSISARRTRYRFVAP